MRAALTADTISDQGMCLRRASAMSVRARLVVLGEDRVIVAAIGGALTGLASTVAGGLGAVYVDFPLPDDHPIFAEDDEPDTGWHG